MRSALRLLHAAEFEAEADVLAHRPPRQQRELLEDHGDGVHAEIAERGAVAGGDVNRRAAVLDGDRTAGDLVQPVDGAHDRRLARAGKAHEHADFAALDGEVDVDRAGDGAGLGNDLVARGAAGEQVERGLAVAAEDDVDVPEFDDRHRRLS